MSALAVERPTYPEEMQWWSPILAKMRRGEPLTPEEAYEATRRAFAAVAEGHQQTPLILAAFFGGLTYRSPTVEQLVAMARALADTRRVQFTFAEDPQIVTGGGTGGDSIPTINVTTPAVLVAAAAGARVVKSASKAFSSRTGAADLAATLGISVEAPPDVVERCVREVGTAVWASQGTYPWMEPLLQLRTHPAAPILFPLFDSLRLVLACSINPFGLRRQIRATATLDAEMVAQVLGRAGHDWVLVPIGYGHGDIRIDEFSNLGPTHVCEYRQGKLRAYTTTPEDFGARRASPEEVRAADTHELNAKRALRVLLGRDRSPTRDLILMNAAAFLYLAEQVDGFRDGFELAVQTVDEGKVLPKLDALVRISGGNPAALWQLVEGL